MPHFLAVARTGSFTHSAEQMNACRSVLTRSIERLEDRIGTRLFDRTTRSVSLTPAGEAFLADVSPIADHFAVAASKARRVGQGSHATLKIGMCASAHSMIDVIAGAVRGYRALSSASHPQLRTTPREASYPTDVLAGVMMRACE